MWAALASISSWSCHTFSAVARVAVPTSGATRALAARCYPWTCVYSFTVWQIRLLLHDQDLLPVCVCSPHLPVSRPAPARSCDSINILSSPLQLVHAGCCAPDCSSDIPSGAARLPRPAAAAWLGRQSCRSIGHVVRNLLSSWPPHLPIKSSEFDPESVIEPFDHSAPVHSPSNNRLTSILNSCCCRVVHRSTGEMCCGLRRRRRSVTCTPPSTAWTPSPVQKPASRPGCDSLLLVLEAGC